MDEIINSLEWEAEWLSLDKDQLVEILNSSCLVVKDEYDLWMAVIKWLTVSIFLISFKLLYIFLIVCSQITALVSYK